MDWKYECGDIRVWRVACGVWRGLNAACLVKPSIRTRSLGGAGVGGLDRDRDRGGCDRDRDPILPNMGGWIYPDLSMISPW